MIRTTSTAFAADLDKFARMIDVDVKTVRRKVAFDLFEKITVRTPVDRGRARGGWAMSDSRLNNTDPGDGSTDGPGVTATFGDAYDLTWIQNTVPYIEKLEFTGHSKQAPSGMARISLAEVEAEIGSFA